MAKQFDYPCPHRGQEVLGHYNCGCGIGEQPIFPCLHPVAEKQKCVIRLGNTRCRPGAKELASCSGCDLRPQPERKSRTKPLPTQATKPARFSTGRPARPGDAHRAAVLAQAEERRRQGPGPGDVLVNCNPHGYGDAVVMAWIAEGSKHAEKKCRLFATGSKRQLLEAFGQNVAPTPAGSIDTFPAYSAELRDKAPSRVIQRGRFLGITTQPARPSYQIVDRHLQWAAENVTRRSVLLFPNTAQGAREWPPLYWVELAELLKTAGLDPIVAVGRFDPRYASLNQWVIKPWGKVLAAMLAARCVVANDSGPLHIAGTLDVPTFALLGPTTAAVFNHMPSVVGLAASPVDIDCVGCYFHHPFSENCQSGCVALSHLMPARVAKAVLRG